MKTFIVILISALSIESYARGYSCEAECIVVHSKKAMTYYLDKIQLQAGVSREETYQLLQKKCQLLAKRNGFRQGSMLVDHIKSLSNERLFLRSNLLIEMSRQQMTLSPSSPAISCRVDKDVADEDIPYFGEIEVL